MARTALPAIVIAVPLVVSLCERDSMALRELGAAGIVLRKMPKMTGSSAAHRRYSREILSWFSDLPSLRAQPLRPRACSSAAGDDPSPLMTW
jgi:hypothetical protein